MPLLFSSHFLKINLIIQAGLSFIVFCLASSCVYIINDLCDAEDDKQHPKKSITRPLASGLMSNNQAYWLLSIFAGLLLWTCMLIPSLILPVGVYLFLNLIYSLGLKHEAVIDIFIIALGFVVRIYAGAIAIEVTVSSWMFVTTLSLALYLAAIKRRQELLLNPNSKILKKYTLVLIDKYAEVSAICAMLFYSLFVMSTKPQLILTIPIVLLGIFRYWYLVEKKNQGESPSDVLFEDWQLGSTILLWLGSCLYVLWP